MFPRTWDDEIGYGVSIYDLQHFFCRNSRVFVLRQICIVKYVSSNIMSNITKNNLFYEFPDIFLTL